DVPLGLDDDGQSTGQPVVSLPAGVGSTDHSASAALSRRRASVSWAAIKAAAASRLSAFLAPPAVPRIRRRRSVLGKPGYGNRLPSVIAIFASAWRAWRNTRRGPARPCALPRPRLPPRPSERSGRKRERPRRPSLVLEGGPRG